MADLLIRNIDDGLRDRLEKLASSHGHSVEEEVLDILREAIGSRKPPPATEGFGSRFAAHFSGRGIGLTKEEANAMELRGHPVKPFDFDR